MNCHLFVISPEFAAHQQPQRWFALEKLIAAGNARLSDTSVELALVGSFQQPVAAELPIAALSLPVELSAPPQAYCLCATPAHLALQRDHLTLHTVDDVTTEEAEALGHAINQHFQDAGMHMLTPNASRWYLQLGQLTEIVTQPFTAALGRNVDGLMPVGQDALKWRQWLNELQMLLFAHPVNIAREARGQLAINTVWLSGGGELFSAVQAAYQSCWANHILAQGLALHAGVQCENSPQHIATVLNEVGEGDHLVVIDKVSLNALENDWCVPLLQALKSGKLQQLKIDLFLMGRMASIHIKRSDLLKFWRKSEPLAGVLEKWFA